MRLSWRAWLFSSARGDTRSAACGVGQWAREACVWAAGPGGQGCARARGWGAGKRVEKPRIPVDGFGFAGKKRLSARFALARTIFVRFSRTKFSGATRGTGPSEGYRGRAAGWPVASRRMRHGARVRRAAAGAGRSGREVTSSGTRLARAALAGREQESSHQKRLSEPSSRPRGGARPRDHRRPTHCARGARRGVAALPHHSPLDRAPPPRGSSF